MMVVTVFDMASGRIVLQTTPESVFSDCEQGIVQTRLQTVTLQTLAIFDQHKLPPELADISVEGFIDRQE
jgi:hypothetical protein